MAIRQTIRHRVRQTGSSGETGKRKIDDREALFYDDFFHFDDCLSLLQKRMIIIVESSYKLNNN